MRLLRNRRAMATSRRLTLVRTKSAPSHEAGLSAKHSRTEARPPLGESRADEVVPAKILVRLPNWVGDTCLALPFLQALRALYPSGHIATLVRSPSVGLASLLPADEVIPLEDRGPVWIRPWQLRRAGAKLRACHFDVAFSLPTTVSSILLLRLAGIPITIGYARGATRLLLSKPLPFLAIKGIHRAAAYLGLVEGLGQLTPPLVWSPSPLAASAKEAGLKRLTNLADARCRIGLGIGSVGTSRRWPAEYYAQLADRLIRELGANITLLGGPGDRPIAQEVTRRMTGPVLDLAGKTRLEEMPGILHALDLVVANDSGLAHLAALTLTPTVVFFGAGDPAVTAPLASTTIVVRENLDCVPCLSNRCRKNHECMTQISVERAFEEARRLLVASKGETP